MTKLDLEMFLPFLPESTKPLWKDTYLKQMAHTSKSSSWKILFSARLLQAKILIVYDRFLLTLYDTIWDVYRKLSTQNPRFLLTCEYCGKAKLRVVDDIWGSGIKKVLLYCKNVPHSKSRQVWICHECIEALK